MADNSTPPSPTHAAAFDVAQWLRELLDGQPEPLRGFVAYARQQGANDRWILWAAVTGHALDPGPLRTWVSQPTTSPFALLGVTLLGPGQRDGLNRAFI